MVQNMLEFAEAQTKAAKLDKLIRWETQLYIDASHSGSAITKTWEWAKKEGAYDFDEDRNSAKLIYFEHKCEL